MPKSEYHSTDVWKQYPIRIPLRTGMFWWKKWICLNCWEEFRTEKLALEHIDKDHPDVPVA